MLKFDDVRREVRRDGELLVAFGRARVAYALFQHIAQHPGLGREALYQRAWGLPYRAPSSDNAFHVALNGLRKRVPVEIELVGEGYQLVGRPETSAAGRLVTGHARWHHTADLRSARPHVGPSEEPIRALLAEHPLIALVGPGGVGKTHRALQLDGMVVDASSARTTEQLDAQLASILDSEDAATGLAARGPALLVLDTVEQLAVPIEPWLRSLVRQSATRIVVTSRRRLDLPTLEVQPLTPDQARGMLHGVDGPVDALAERCGHLPLALELARRPALHLGAQAVLDRPMLMHDPSRPDRQASPEGVHAWSVSLLPDDSRAALERLAVFAGPFEASAVQSAADVTSAQLSSLADLSLVVTRGGRHRLVWPVATEVPDRLRVRHLDWLLARVQRQGLWVRTERAQSALDSMQAVLVEAMAALRFAVQRVPERAARLAWALDPLFERRGLSVFRAEVAALVAELDHPAALLFRAREARWRGDLRAAEALFDRLPDGHRPMGLASIALLRGQDPRPWLEQADFPDDVEWQARLIGMRAVHAEEPEVALREAEAMHRLRGDARGQALVLAKLAGQLADEDRLDEALRCIEAAMQHSNRLGDTVARGVQGGLLGLIQHLRGDLDAAERVYTDSMSELAGRPRSQAIARLNRAFLRIETERDPRSELYLVRQGWPELAAWAELGLAVVEAREGRPQAAARWRERAGSVQPKPGTAEARLVARLTRASPA